jgi:hypothetical protein
MRRVNWLFEKDTHDDSLQGMMSAADELGVPYQVYDFRPFELRDRLAELFSPKACVVVYGSIQLCHAVSKFASWVPGCYSSFPAYKCTSYYPILSSYLLNSNYVMIPYGELKRRKDFLINSLGEDNCVFIRPDAGLKTFTGKVVARENFEVEIDKFGFYDTMPSDLCVVATPFNITREWRCLIVDRKVVASSLYLPERERDCPQEVVDLAAEIAQKYEPDKCWTIDICQLKDGTLKLLEIGSFSCAGMYKCDPRLIIKSVTEQAEKDHQELIDG